MADESQYQVPRQLRAGDTLSWRRRLSDYPASAGWVLKYTRVSAASASTFAAAADGDEHAITVAAADSVSWPAGVASLVEFVEKGAVRITLAQIPVTILPDLAAATGGMDTRSHARRVLDNLTAWLESKSVTAGEYQLDGRRLRNYDLAALLALRDRYAAIVANETAGPGGMAQRVLVQL